VNIEQLLSNLSKFPVMETILLTMLIVGFIILVYVQSKKDNFDLRWLISDDGLKPSIHKIGQVTALTVSTWGFVALLEKNLLTETYFGAYMSIWMSSGLIDKFISKRDNGASTNADNQN
jgi:hypothetical protein